jgi:hypothetical protein
MCSLLSCILTPCPPAPLGHAMPQAHDAQLLDFARCEFLLVGAADDIQQELGECRVHCLHNYLYL